VATLALDCCLDATSVAILGIGPRGETLLLEDYFEHPAGKHDGRAETLMPMLEALSARVGGLDAVHRIAVTIGPGSFTGVRVGLAAARGLGLALNRPVVGTSTLAVIAHRADTLFAGGRLGVKRDGAEVAVALDARQGQVFLQRFGASVAEPLGVPALLSVEAAVTELCAAAAAGARIIAIGSGAPLLAAGAGDVITVALPNLQPHARHLAQLAPALSSGSAEPLYLRAPDARPQSSAALPRTGA
jgi:tRNA threonylcarbamoyladenosine biosynthesis protein TsaB